MSALVEQGFTRAKSAADHAGDRVGGEVNARRNWSAVIAPGDDRPVHEAVFVFSAAIDQVEQHVGAAVSDAHGGERATPATHRVGKREIGVLLARAVTSGRELDIPRLDRVGSAACGELFDRADSAVPRARFEFVEQREHFVLRHTLDALGLPVVVVLGAQQAAQSIAFANHI